MDQNTSKARTRPEIDQHFLNLTMKLIIEESQEKRNDIFSAQLRKTIGLYLLGYSSKQANLILEYLEHLFIEQRVEIFNTTLQCVQVCDYLHEQEKKNMYPILTASLELDPQFRAIRALRMPNEIDIN